MKNRDIAFLALTTFALLMANPAAASDKDAVAAVVKQYTQAFNNNDRKALSSSCTDNAVVIDDFAPHLWQGANACGNWWNDFAATAKKQGIVNGMLTLGDAWHLYVTGDRAYAVYPARFTYKMNGKPVAEQGVWTFALQKLAAGWRIAGWGWALH